VAATVLPPTTDAFTLPAQSSSFPQIDPDLHREQLSPAAQSLQIAGH
jgi:hypothetical protein